MQRIRFEHPEVRSVVMAPAAEEPRFLLGGQHYMLGLCQPCVEGELLPVSPTRPATGIEDASRHSGLKFIAACNGSTAGGGYELALACDEIVLVDDAFPRPSVCPELPLLGVLPGTGGLTRLIDKRKVRRDQRTYSARFPRASRGSGPRSGTWSIMSPSYRISRTSSPAGRRSWLGPVIVPTKPKA